MAASNQAILDLFGADNVQLWHAGTNKSASPSDVLANKLILFYFSAHWCGPCRQFTPILADFYRTLKGRNRVPGSTTDTAATSTGTTSNGGASLVGEDFEIVFVSLDRSAQQYRDYAAEMPWWSTPFQSAVNDILAKKYRAAGIPHLVVLDRDGTVLIPDAVGEVATDLHGAHFPWRPRPVIDLLPTQYITHDKTTRRDMSDLDDKYLMLYFSAHWCPPCQRFTPLLSKAYTALCKQRDDFELLYVSSDHDEAEFSRYFSEMTFGALPYEEREAKMALSKRLRIHGIPTLLILGPRPRNSGSTGNGGVGGGDRPLINVNVRRIVESGDYLSDFPYHPKPYGDLNAISDDISLNENRCVVVFHEGGDDAEQEDIQEVLQMAARHLEGSDQSLRFYWAVSYTGLAKSIRQALSLGSPGPEPLMVLLDIPGGRCYYVSPEKDITLDTVLAFVQDPGEKRSL